jgi:hypothetical protein
MHRTRRQRLGFLSVTTGAGSVIRSVEPLHVSRRVYRTFAIMFALVATGVGWSQSLIYKETPLVPLALWFPLVVITGARDLVAVALSLIQFPLLAIAFISGARHWSIPRVLAVLFVIYALLAGVAVVILMSR